VGRWWGLKWHNNNKCKRNREALLLEGTIRGEWSGRRESQEAKERERSVFWSRSCWVWRHIVVFACKYTPWCAPLIVAVSKFESDAETSETCEKMRFDFFSLAIHSQFCFSAKHQCHIYRIFNNWSLRLCLATLVSLTLHSLAHHPESHLTSSQAMAWSSIPLVHSLNYHPSSTLSNNAPPWSATREPKMD